MDDENIDVTPPSEGVHTGQVRKVVESEMQVVKRIQFWVTLGLLVAGGGFAAALYLGRYAQATEVQVLSTKVDDVGKVLQSHIATENNRLTAVEQQARYFEEDSHFTRDQLWRIAERVGAQKLPAPKH